MVKRNVGKIEWQSGNPAGKCQTGSAPSRPCAKLLEVL
eukprot:CAMPEP_0174351608 /NCGR_PEP_ID=MMETSP0811_2-20130205/9027_1 /TAXON_ID=73025 ORGANISM="Eutreptiella gymnastica-like, Strain CCMP1594" /NCGR_SAMPLE_ID=MMETSP0811_2 /ASSEMBLY_ACC=CAM_ASM_000667 /LENGTH=37 /DNA_ID= /DNA_START= /DNA_END= /DNA_ORIENTATION=